MFYRLWEWWWRFLRVSACKGLSFYQQHPTRPSRFSSPSCQTGPWTGLQTYSPSWDLLMFPGLISKIWNRIVQLSMWHTKANRAEFLVRCFSTDRCFHNFECFNFKTSRWWSQDKIWCCAGQRILVQSFDYTIHKRRGQKYFVRSKLMLSLLIQLFAASTSFRISISILLRFSLNVRGNSWFHHHNSFKSSSWWQLHRFPSTLDWNLTKWRPLRCHVQTRGKSRAQMISSQ